jgi:hypothetical protein
MAETDNVDDFNRALARASILCTSIAWLSQFACVLILGRPPATVFCLLAVLQFVLITCGFILSLVCLVGKQPQQSTGTRRAALIGLVLSSGTILLVAFLFLRLVL